jgi:hypothetical protein
MATLLARGSGVPALSVLVGRPLGSGADDGPQLTSLLSLANGKKVYLSPGLYTVATPIVVPSNTNLELDPNVVIQSTMANTGVGGFTNSVFFATKSNVGATNNLTADAVQGSNTISVTSSVPVGSTIMIGYTVGGNQQQQATVLATSGSGPFVLTLDEEILFPYWTVANGAYVYTFTGPQKIRIMGNGARVWGTGDRVCEIAFCRDVHVDGIVCDQRLNTGTNGFLNIQFSFDIGGRDCGFTRCRADGGSGILSGTVGLVGFALEGTSRGYIHDCVAQNFATASAYGLGFLDTRNCSVVGHTSRNCVTGVYVGSNDSHGTSGSQDLDIEILQTQNCSSVGVSFDKTSTVRIRGWTDTGSSASCTQLGGAAVAQISQFTWKAPATGAYNGFLSIFGEMILVDGLVDMTSASGVKTICDWGSGAAGTLRMDRVRTVAGNYGLYLEDGIAQRVILGDMCDFSSVATAPIRKGTLSKLNFGQLTANGTSTVAVTAACTSKDSVVLTQASGTPLGVLVLSGGQCGADTFSVIGLAGDTATYNWRIVRAGGP